MMAETALNPDAGTILAHLSHITRRWAELNEPCELELVFLDAHDAAQVKDVRRFTIDRLAEAAAHAAGMNRHRVNAYVVVNPVRAGSLAPGRRASTADILAAFFHWADADDAQAAANIKSFVGPAYTFAVTTGRQPCVRPHVYWELEEPTRNLAAWEATQRAIAAALSTDPAVVDPPRIMRLAGTVNWPKPRKVAKGYVAEVTTLSIHDREPVSSERMAYAFIGAPKADKPGAQTDGASFDFDTGASPDGIDMAELIRRIHAGEGWHHPVVQITGKLVRKGLSDADIHAFTDGFTQAGYTVEDTRSEVQAAIDGARRKGWGDGAAGDTGPDFDFPNGGDGTPEGMGWVMQSAAEFTADFVAPEYIVDGVLRRGLLYTLTAPTGSGKTAVMLYAATAIASAMRFADRDVEPGDVLFMAGENPDDVRARFIAAMEFYGIDPAQCRVHFIAGTFSIRSDMERLREAAATLPNLMLVVIDTFAAYFDGDDENSNAQALDFARVARRLTAFPSRPAVVMPAHPVKNATRQNLAPKGGSSLVNEVDGNLTLWNDEGVLTLHWQVKFRGAEFEPLQFELEKFTSDSLKDHKGRLMPTILAKPMLELRARQLAMETMQAEDKLLLNVEEYPAQSLSSRAVEIGLVGKDGKPARQKVDRLLRKLQDQKLVKRLRGNWELTAEGRRAVDIIQNGPGFTPDGGL